MSDQAMIPGTNVSPEVIDKAIKASPTFRHAIRLWKITLALGATGLCLSAFTIVWGCSAGSSILDAHEWLIFHYTVAGLAMVFHIVFIFYIKSGIDDMASPLANKINFGQALASKAVAISFFAYLFAKLRTRANAEVFGASCSSNCSGKLQVVRLSPLITAVLLAMCWVAQLGLFYLMYNTTALNPPPNWPDDIEGTFGIKLPRTASKENLVSSSRKGKSTSLNPDHEELSFSDSGDEEKSYLGGNAPLIKGSTTVTGTEFELGHGNKGRRADGFAQKREKMRRKYAKYT